MEKLLPLQTSWYSNIYLESSLYLAIILNDYDIERFRLQMLTQYASVSNQGDLIYRLGYVRVFDEFTNPGTLVRYVDETKISDEILLRPGLSQWIKGQIDQDSYVLLDIDEHYLQGSYYYDRVHYYRKILIYGYDTDDRLFFAYTHNKYARFVSVAISFDQVTTLLENSSKENIPNAYKMRGCTLRRKSMVQELVKTCDIWKALSDYGQSRSEIIRDTDSFIVEKRFYGPLLYEALICAVEKKRDNLELIDYRAFGMLRENKRLMASLLESLKPRLVQSHLLTELIDLSKALAKRLGQFLYEFLRCYEFSKKPLVLDKIIAELNDIKKLEIQAAVKLSCLWEQGVQDE